MSMGTSHVTRATILLASIFSTISVAEPMMVVIKGRVDTIVDQTTELNGLKATVDYGDEWTLSYVVDYNRGVQSNSSGGSRTTYAGAISSVTIDINDFHQSFEVSDQVPNPCVIDVFNDFFNSGDSLMTYCRYEAIRFDSPFKYGDNDFYEVSWQLATSDSTMLNSATDTTLPSLTDFSFTTNFVRFSLQSPVKIDPYDPLSEPLFYTLIQGPIISLASYPVYIDGDSDGIIDSLDNCPTVANPDQLDSTPDIPGGDACVDPNFIPPNGVDVPSTTIIESNVVLNTGVSLGDNVTLEEGAEVNKDTTLGDYVTVGETSTLSKDIIVGSNTSIGVGVTVNQDVYIGSGVNIGNGVYIDRGSVICNNVSIGNMANIGKNVLVKNDPSLNPDIAPGHSLDADKGVSVDPSMCSLP